MLATTECVVRDYASTSVPQELLVDRPCILTKLHVDVAKCQDLSDGWRTGSVSASTGTINSQSLMLCSLRCGWQVTGDNMRRRGTDWAEGEEEAFKAPIRKKYEDEGSCYYSSARLWDDGVIPPEATREVR